MASLCLPPACASRCRGASPPWPKDQGPFHLGRIAFVFTGSGTWGRPHTVPPGSWPRSGRARTAMLCPTSGGHAHEIQRRGYGQVASHRSRSLADRVGGHRLTGAGVDRGGAAGYGAAQLLPAVQAGRRQHLQALIRPAEGANRGCLFAGGVNHRRAVAIRLQ